MQTELKIKGMSCGHCVRTVESALRALPAVRSVDEVQVGRAVVQTDGPLDRNEVARALDDAGFALEQ